MSSSVASLTSELDERRAALATDVELLGSLLSPASLKSRLLPRSLTRVSSRSHAADDAATSGTQVTGITRFINDARDGDPASLAVITAAAGTLVLVSTIALARAVRALRSH